MQKVLGAAVVIGVDVGEERPGSDPIGDHVSPDVGERLEDRLDFGVAGGNVICAAFRCLAACLDT
jgi:hypothetical protein